MSVYGLKFRRTDPSHSVASMLTYSASSRTSILRRHRRTIRVAAIPSPPQRGLHLDVLCPDSTAGTGYFLERLNALWPGSRPADVTGGRPGDVDRATRPAASPPRHRSLG